MTKVVVLTTVWQRPRITSFHFRWMDWFRKECKKLGVELMPLYVLSEDDGCKEVHRKTAERYGHLYITCPRTRLTIKSNAGLEYIKDRIPFDWLMHLDSDEILSLPLMKRWAEEFEKGTVWFGSSGCYFINFSGQAWEFPGYDGHPVKNGGTCLAREIIEASDYNLWPVQRDMGLNSMERRHVQELGYQIKAIDTQENYGVVEIKGEASIHPMKWFHKRACVEVLTERQHDELLAHHPLLHTL